MPARGSQSAGWGNCGLVPGGGTSTRRCCGLVIIRGGGRKRCGATASGKPLVYFFMLFMLFCAFISEKSKSSEKAFCF